MTASPPLPSPSPAPGAAPRPLPGGADADARPAVTSDGAATFAALALGTDDAGVLGAGAERAELWTAMVADAGQDGPRRPPGLADSEALPGRKAGGPWTGPSLSGLHLPGPAAPVGLSATVTSQPRTSTARPLTDAPVIFASERAVSEAAPEALRGEPSPAPRTQDLAARTFPAPSLPPASATATIAEAAPAPSALLSPEAAPAAPASLREASAPPLTAKLAAAPPEPAQQLARAVAHAPAERVVEVRLDPPHLGRVRIEFDFSGEAVRAVVSAAEPEALGLLRRGGAGLARDLADMGYAGADIEYEHAGDRADGAGWPEPAGLAFALPSPAEGSAPGATRVRVAHLHDGALDITL